MSSRRASFDAKVFDPEAKPSGTGCAECEAAEGWWFHLRRCALCGHVGCCDNSPGQHATKHFRGTGHPVIQSFEPEEDWFWDYRDAAMADGPELAAPRSHPCIAANAWASWASAKRLDVKTKAVGLHCHRSGPDACWPPVLR